MSTVPPCPEPRQAPTGHARSRALCCRCGTIRTTTLLGGSGEWWKEDEPVSRCLITRKCATCSERTPHAYLRVDGWADYAEEMDTGHFGPRPDHPRDWDYALPEVELDVEVERLEACEVRVYAATKMTFEDHQALVLVQNLQDGRWFIITNPEVHPEGLLAALRQAWSVMALPRRTRWSVEPNRPGLDLDPLRSTFITWRQT